MSKTKTKRKQKSQYMQFIIHYYKGAYKEQMPTLTDTDFYNMVKDIIENAIKEEDNIAFSGHILHDKCWDWEKDMLKPAHVHLVILLKSGVKKTISNIAKRFKVTQARNVENCVDFFEQCRYMLHITDQALLDKKHVYDISALKCQFLAPRTVENRPIRNVWDCLIPMERKDEKKILKENKSSTIDGLLKNVENGTITRSEALKSFDNNSLKFTRKEKITFMNETDKMVISHNQRLIDDMRLNGRNLTTILISCDSDDTTGVGKTTIGEKILSTLYGSNYFNGASNDKKKTPDLLQGYSGEKAAIIDEFRGDEFNQDAFKNSFDRFHYSPISSRNKNLNFIGETVVFTSSYKIEDIIFNMLKYSEGGSRYFNVDIKNINPRLENIKKEFYKDSKQVARRIPLYVYLKKLNNGDLNIKIYRWDNIKNNSYLNRGYGLIFDKIIKNYDPDNEKHILFIAEEIIREIKNETLTENIIPMKYINEHFIKFLPNMYQNAFKEIKDFNKYEEVIF